MIMEVEWEDTCTEPQVERVVPVYNKTDVSGLQTFLRDKFVVGKATAATCRRFGILLNIIYETIERFVLHKKTLKENSDPEN